MKYKDWEILEEIPDGWSIDKTAGAPIPYAVFITNGKSVLNGQKRALLRVQAKRNEIGNHFVETTKTTEPEEPEEPAIIPVKTVNDLARVKFKEQLLKEILVDLMVCEIENWDKKEYINELKNLINGINTSKQN